MLVSRELFEPSRRIRSRDLQGRRQLVGTMIEVQEPLALVTREAAGQAVLRQRHEIIQVQQVHTWRIVLTRDCQTRTIRAERSPRGAGARSFERHKLSTR